MITISIDNQFIETSDGLSVSIANAVENAISVTDRSFKHTYTITIENNAKNRGIFGVLDPTKSNNFSNVIPRLIEIFSDGTKIFDGNVKVTEVTSDEIKFFCISSDASWISDIQGDLKELEFDTQYEFYGSRPNGSNYPSDAVFVVDFWSGNTSTNITTNEILQFPLISYGNFYVGQWNITSYAGSIFNTDRPLNLINGITVHVLFRPGIVTNIDSEIFQIEVLSQTQFRLRNNGILLVLTTGIIPTIYSPGTMNIYQTTEYYDVGKSPLESIEKYAIIHELELEDVPPCVNVKKTFDTIFNTAGWKITSSFMEQDSFKNLYLTYSGKDDPQWNRGRLSYVELDDTSILLTTGTTYYETGSRDSQSYNYIMGFIDSDETNDYFGTYDKPGGYLVPKTGRYNIKVGVTGTTEFQFAATIGHPNQRNLVYLSKRANKQFVDDFENPNAGLGVIDVLTGNTPTLQSGNYLPLVPISNLDGNESILFVTDVNWRNATATHTGDIVAPYDVPLTVHNFARSSEIAINSNTMSTRDPQVSGSPHSYQFRYNIDFDIDLTKGEALKFTNSYGGVEMSFLSSSEIDIFHSEIVMIENEDGTIPDELLNPAKMMPEMSKVDFVKSVMVAFNLYSRTDSFNKNILFEPREIFTLPSQFGLDFTGKEYTEFKISPLDLARDYTFRWLEDQNDIWARPLEASPLNNIQLWTKYGDGVLLRHLEYDNSDGNSIVQVPKIGFCAERLYKSKVPGSTTGFVIPTMMGKEDEFVPQRNVSWKFNHPPKIVEWNGLRFGAWIFDDQAQAYYPFAASTSATGFTLTWYDKTLFNGVNIATLEKGMFSTYYGQQFNEYINSELTEITFVIDIKDFLELDTRRQIFWNQCHYRVLDVQYTPTTGLAKLKMIKTNI